MNEFSCMEVYEYPIKLASETIVCIKSISSSNDNNRINGICNNSKNKYDSCDPLIIEYSNNIITDDIPISFLEKESKLYKLIKNIIILPEYKIINVTPIINTPIEYSVINSSVENLLIKYSESKSHYGDFITKLKVDIGSNIILFGDFHGSVHTFIRSLLRLFLDGYINKNCELSEHTHIIFLGDIIDRGIYSNELLYIILELKNINHNNIHICKGNHETYEISTKYGFLKELIMKYNNRGEEIFNKITGLWKYLPNAIFVTNDNNKYIQLCHGGFIRDANTINTFINSSNDYKYITESESNDLLWSDFVCGKNNNISNNIGIYGSNNIYRGIGRLYTADDTLNYIKYVDNLYGIIRGHQDTLHNSKLIFGDNNICTNTNTNNNISKIINTFDNTRILSQPVDWKKVSNIKVEETDKYSTRFPFLTDKTGYENTLIPAYTFSTAVTTRGITSDGYAILKYKVQGGGGLTYMQKYKKYKKKYITIKKNEIITS